MPKLYIIYNQQIKNLEEMKSVKYFYTG